MFRVAAVHVAFAVAYALQSLFEARTALCFTCTWYTVTLPPSLWADLTGDKFVYLLYCDLFHHSFVVCFVKDGFTYPLEGH